MYAYKELEVNVRLWALEEMMRSGLQSRKWVHRACDTLDHHTVLIGVLDIFLVHLFQEDEFVSLLYSFVPAEPSIVTILSSTP